MKNCVLITCDNAYVPKAIVALKKFVEYNAEYDKIIMGTKFTSDIKKICKENCVKVCEVNLYKDFPKLNKRPKGKQYPIECFYHFYAYKILRNYNFIIKIEPDVYTNKKIDINLNKIKYIGGSCLKKNHIKKFTPLMRDYKKIKKIYKKTNIKIPRILAGVKIYNVKNLHKIKFYETIVKYYKTCLRIKAPRCGDDTLMIMYQMLNSNKITLLNYNFHVFSSHNIITPNKINNVTFYHFVSKNHKYWNLSNSKNKIDNKVLNYFYEKMIHHINTNFKNDFVKKIF